MNTGFGMMPQDIIGGGVDVVVIPTYMMEQGLRKFQPRSSILCAVFANGSRTLLRIEVLR
jgi:hypothetical protein